jgi:hypothetical protein
MAAETTADAVVFLQQHPLRMPIRLAIAPTGAPALLEDAHHPQAGTRFLYYHIAAIWASKFPRRRSNFFFRRAFVEYFMPCRCRADSDGRDLLLAGDFLAIVVNRRCRQSPLSSNAIAINPCQRNRGRIRSPGIRTGDQDRGSGLAGKVPSRPAGMGARPEAIRGKLLPGLVLRDYCSTIGFKLGRTFFSAWIIYSTS